MSMTTVLPRTSTPLTITTFTATGGAGLVTLAITPSGTTAAWGIAIFKGATGFIVGAAERTPKDLEDFGYLMEHVILFATDLGMGTCWLGGTFSKSRFAGKIEAARGKNSFKVGIVMDDKIITIEMPWTTIRSANETGLAEYILNQMREARDAIN